MSNKGKRIMIIPPSCRGLPDLYFTDKQMVLNMIILSKDFPSYEELEELHGKTVCGQEAEFNSYSGGDGARYSLNVPSVGLAYSELTIPRDLIAGYGDSGEESAKNAISLLEELPVKIKEQYGKVFEFTIKDWICGASEFEKGFFERLKKAKGKLRLNI